MIYGRQFLISMVFLCTITFIGNSVNMDTYIDNNTNNSFFLPIHMCCVFSINKFKQFFFFFFFFFVLFCFCVCVVLYNAEKCWPVYMEYGSAAHHPLFTKTLPFLRKVLNLTKKKNITTGPFCFRPLTLKIPKNHFQNVKVYFCTQGQPFNRNDHVLEASKK